MDRICKDCHHAERWECGSKLTWYCGNSYDKRTDNKKVKIKAGQLACKWYKEKIKI